MLEILLHSLIKHGTQLVIVKHTLTYNGGLISEISAEAPSQEVQSISTSLAQQFLVN